MKITSNIEDAVLEEYRWDNKSNSMVPNGYSSCDGKIITYWREIKEPLTWAEYIEGNAKGTIRIIRGKNHRRLWKRPQEPLT